MTPNQNDKLNNKKQYVKDSLAFPVEAATPAQHRQLRNGEGSMNLHTQKGIYATHLMGWYRI